MRPRQARRSPQAGADVVIVGAGSAGSMLAERISRDPACTVIVVEAGAGPGDRALTVALADGRQLPIAPGSNLARRYPAELTTTAPVATATLVRGRVVGGSGAINGGYFCRGLPADFDQAGPPGWSWAQLIDNFRAIETDLDFDGPLHGTAGPITVRRERRWADGSRHFAEAAVRAGFTHIADLNGADAAAGGFGAVPLNLTASGRRADPGSACLIPALQRDNLTLRTGLAATGIDIVDGRASGVRVVGAGGPRVIGGDRIVLCAGAVESAHLLMLSGVGPAPMLRAAGVVPLIDLPVGSACSDHPEWLVSSAISQIGPAAVLSPVLDVVLHDGDVEIRPYTRSFAAMSGSDDGLSPQIGVALMRPRARGRLTLTSADSRVAPRIEQRYDTEPADLAELRRGLSLLGEILGADPGTPTWSSSQHLCGTAPMGAGDAAAVLDPRCRVRGIEGLWVVDASALPRVPARGPHATVAMLGHRAAEFVLDRPPCR